jgi:hypothetical protein
MNNDTRILLIRLLLAPASGAQVADSSDKRIDAFMVEDPPLFDGEPEFRKWQHNVFKMTHKTL